ncbi:extracellular solute-binding protein [Acetanaerobacterium elongatum]|uniref:Carbohydrate ABC transporter substrate-binding protein, CUT1 family n=1 Tax=Acetanaerobacterium elongatum TaxID=258515 RepID=A0A1H0B276_9FIRM|nr:extracellular solute-binding protein [Acetanaerobacterium elongatum]SDN39757.1 carbohydrate ABC transporter substrate-binding protein, CUT1 family [Acetanaerobacterium elongatum]
MKDKALKVLAVADPAVLVYIDDKLGVMRNFGRRVEFDVFPWEQYYTTMMEVFKGKAYYDAVMVAGHLWKRDFVDKGYLAPIEFEDEDILPAIAQEMKYNGKAYLSPSFCDGHMIVYRKDMTDKRFGDIITPQEYAVFCTSFEVPSIAMKAHPSEIFTDALPFLRMNGQDVYDRATHKAVCDCEQVIRGLEVYCSLKKYALEGTESFGNEQIAQVLRNRRAAAAVTWSGQLGTLLNKDCIKPENLGFATFSTAWNVTWSFAINAHCENMQEANELLRYLRSPEVDAVAGAYSGAPVRERSYLTGKDKYPWYSCQLNMIKNSKPLPDQQGAGDKNAVFYEEIAAAFSGKKTPKVAMSDAQKRINEQGGFTA